MDNIQCMQKVPRKVLTTLVELLWSPPPHPIQSTFFFFLQKVKVFCLKSIRLPVPIVKYCLKLILVSIIQQRLSCIHAFICLDKTLTIVYLYALK